MKRYLVVNSIKRDFLFPPPTRFLEHPASLDGVVPEERLVEVKRIFPGTMTLKEALCSLIVNQNHAYYQVQQQLFCSGYKLTKTWFCLT